jgi:hypothetical protein
MLSLWLLQYDAKRRASPDPAVEPFVKRSIESAGLLSKIFGGKPPKFSQQARSGSFCCGVEATSLS